MNLSKDTTCATTIISKFPNNLFTALSLPDELRPRLAALGSGIDGARWVEPENLHITLRFIGEVLNEPRPRARLWGTAATVCQAVAAGAAVVRVHDVGPIVQTCRMAEALFKPNAANRAPQTPA